MKIDLNKVDDIKLTIFLESEKKDWYVKVISCDQDLLQLVSDHVTVDLTKKGVSDVVSYTPSSMKEEMELTPSQIIDLKALMGDSSDNIPGVPGVGVKRATNLLKEYQTLDNIYDNLDKCTCKKLYDNLTNLSYDAY